MSRILHFGNLSIGKRPEFLETLNLWTVLQKQTAVVHSVDSRKRRWNTTPMARGATTEEVWIEVALFKETNAGLSLVA